MLGKKKSKTVSEIVDEIIKKSIDLNTSFQTSSVATAQRVPFGSLPNISHTDKDARGVFPYQEPERDEQGTYYGYKVLYKENTKCGCPECISLKSPKFPSVWMNGELTSHKEPDVDTMNGIHFTKRFNHPELEWWASKVFSTSVVVVRCALSGTIVETEQGFRAQHARIVEATINDCVITYPEYVKYLKGEQFEYRRSGKDYKEIARDDSSRITEARYINGKWDI